MNIYPFQAVYPNVDLISSFDTFIKSAKYKYPQYVKSGFYQKYHKDAMFIYQLSFGTKTIYGLICTTNIENLMEGKALKHEDTIATKEQDTMDYIMQRKAFIKPILLAHKQNKTLAALKKKYVKKKNILLEFKMMNRTKHTYYIIDNGQDIENISKIFERRINTTFIADGHHRSSASKLLFKKSAKGEGKKYNKILTAYFSIKDLEIWDYNRIIKGLNHISPTKLMAKLSENFDIKLLAEPKRQSKNFTYLMYVKQEWYALSLKQSVLAAWKKKHDPLISTSILNEIILKDIFEVKDIRFDTRIKYVPGTQGFKVFEEKVDGNPDNVGFLFTPVTKKDFMAVAQKGNVLPPKSTWFEPRLVNGVLNQEL